MGTPIWCSRARHPWT